MVDVDQAENISWAESVNGKDSVIHNGKLELEHYYIAELCTLVITTRN